MADSTASFSPARTLQIDALSVRIHHSQADLARDAAGMASDYLREVLDRQGEASVILATGNSQIQFLEAVHEMGRVDWSKVTLFHMDEYLGIDPSHKASFRCYMRERVAARLRPRTFHYLEGDALEPLAECDRYTKLLETRPIDLCCLGIGENGHIAFNDPPVADFEDPRRVKIVQLDEACRMQQVGEGHFPNLDAVPQFALTLTIPMLCSARRMLCIVPEQRKARAVKNALRGPVSTECPGSYLRRQPQATLFLDADSASLLDDGPANPGF